MDILDLSPEAIERASKNKINVHFQPPQMVLVRLTSLQTGVPPTKEHRTPFSIILTAEDKQCYFSQGIYTVEWDELGTFELFLVPIGPTAEGMNYQAVFG